MHSVTLVFVDDDEDDRFLLQHAYKKAGLTTAAKFLGSARAAMDLLAPNPTSRVTGLSFGSYVIFLDLNMPGVNGFDFLKWIRGQSSLRFIPVVILSTSENPSDIQKAYELGANGYLVKAHSAAELSELLKTAHNFWAVSNRFVT